MITEQILINVKYASNSEQILTNESQTVGGLRTLVSARFEIVCLDDVILVFAGKILPDIGTIKQYEINNDAIVHLVLKKQRPIAENSGEPVSSILRSGTRKIVANGKVGKRVRSIAYSKVQCMFADPEYIRQAIYTDPRMKRALKEYPHIRHIVNDDRNLREFSTLCFNRAKLDEVKRVRDLNLLRFETIPGGMAALYRLANVFNDTYDDSVPKLPPVRAYFNPQRGKENRLPLPNPWIKSKHNRKSSRQTIYTNNGKHVKRSTLEKAKSCSDLDLIKKTDIVKWVKYKIRQKIALNSSKRQSTNTKHNKKRIVEVKVHVTVCRNGDVHTNIDAIESLPLDTQELTNICEICNRETSSDGSSSANQSEYDDCIQTSPEIRYHTQLEQLSSLGFNNREENLRALMDSFGDVNAAVERLKTSSN